ncbi:hypothetical protein ACHAXT_010685 [Thalassiosira profunda]
MSHALIIDRGFAVLSDFKPGAAAADDGKRPGGPIPRHPFASYANALSMTSARAAFLGDCAVVFDARTKEDSAEYSTGSTYFLPCQMKPRCALEGLAQKIFRAHVDSLPKWEDKDGEKKLLYDPEMSGAEWWTLVLDTPSDKAAGKSENGGDDDEEEEEEDDEVGMHFDADYGLEESLPDYHVHPRVATVTYLSDTGVPTLILDKCSPAPTDAEKTSLNGSISKAWLSHPSFGKHVAFNGRYLHGAPGEYFPTVAKKSIDTSEPSAKKAKTEESTGAMSGKRVTFLVNIWLNHCPQESEPLNDHIVQKLSTPWEDAHDGANSDLKSDESYTPPFQWQLKDIATPDTLSNEAKLKRAAENSKGPAGVEDIILCNRHVDITFGAPMEEYHGASRLAAEEGSMPIEMEDGVFALKVGKEASSDEEEDGEDE